MSRLSRSWNRSFGTERAERKIKRAFGMSVPKSTIKGGGCLPLVLCILLLIILLFL